MPTILVNQANNPGATRHSNYLALEAGTSSSEEDWTEYLEGRSLPTGSPRYSLYEVLGALGPDHGMTGAPIPNCTGHNDAIIRASMYLRQLQTGAFDNRNERLSLYDHALPEQFELVKFMVPAISSVMPFLDEINSTLMHRINQFEEEKTGLQKLSPSTKGAVRNLVGWLSSQCETVSANVFDDEVLSVASVFPDDVRLYIEIERDGSAGAAVTKQRRIAVDVYGSNVFDLTPEVILAAVGSV